MFSRTNASIFLRSRSSTLAPFTLLFVFQRQLSFDMGHRLTPGSVVCSLIAAHFRVSVRHREPPLVKRNDVLSDRLPEATRDGISNLSILRACLQRHTLTEMSELPHILRPTAA